MCGPFGAVKEQSSGRYAQRLAEQGFLTIAFDPSFAGESGGSPRYVASPDINTKDFSAAVDYLSTSDEVDADRIGILGVCGWGGMAVSAAINGPRIKATYAVTMYNMSRVTANGYFDGEDSADARNNKRAQMCAQRTIDYATGDCKRGGGVIDPLPEDVPQFVKDYHDYYKTPRGYHARSLNSNDGWNVTSNLPFLNFPLLTYANEIENPVLLVHGEKAHSLNFSEDTYKMLESGVKPENKELLVIPGATHCDLYDNDEYIPWDKLQDFFKKNLG